MIRSSCSAGVLAIALAALAPATAPAKQHTSLVEVKPAKRAVVNRLAAQGLDVVRVGRRSAEVMLHSSADRARLRASGLRTRVVVANLDRRNRAARRAEARLAARAKADPKLESDLPTGRVAYRTLDEINAELKRLERRYPREVELFQLPHRSLLGQRIYGIEISHDVKRDHGKPVFLLTGVHHAREWPTAEFTLEFAWDLLENDGHDARISSLLEGGRLIAVPVVNPDGYDISRRLVQEQKRKNCRVTPGEIPTRAECEDPANFNFGVDLNRNYGTFWGGPGSSASRTASNHRGEAPWSEPEIQNTRALAASHQITVAINNHTPDARLLRAPSASNEPVPADVVPYDALAQKLGAILGWPAGPWPEIYYEASGTAEQHAYYSAGTFGFTPEATPGHSGNDTFHPPYEYVIDQYLGEDFYEDSTMREAYMTAFEAAVDPALHSVITGRAPRGAKLTIAKEHTLETSLLSDGDGPFVLPFEQRQSSTITVPADGRFTWHVNPSWRPSQHASAHLRESWTISCGKRSETTVSVARGATATVDLSRCKR
jgi:carboxypeptidase T